MATQVNNTAYYTQKDFEQIIHKGINYTIPMDILNSIRKLEEKVKQNMAHSAATVTHRHNHYHSTKNGHGNNPNSTSNPSNNPTSSNSMSPRKPETWKSEKPVAVAMALKSTTPLHQMKLLLNKLSASNYEKLHSEIMDVLELTPEIGKEIVAFLSRTTDMTMSELYTNLFLSLESKHPEFFGPLLESFWTQYEENWRNKVPGMAPNEEHDDYYTFIKSMTELRGQSMFLAQWCRHRDAWARGTAMIQTLFRQMENVCAELCGKQKTKIDEWTEQIFIWVKVLGPQRLYRDNPEIWALLEKWGQIQIKTVPNMTSRSKFKFQEIVKWA